MTDKTAVRCKPETRDRLRRRKVGGDTYDDVLNRLLEETEELEVAYGN